MIPDWLKKNDDYVPPRGGGTFALKTIRSISEAVSRLRFQQGHEKAHAFPALLKLCLLFLSILLISFSRNSLILMAFTAVSLLYLSFWPAKDILHILKSTLFAVILSFLLLLPAMLMDPSGIANQLRIIWKVFLSVLLVLVFSHTTQWNHITSSLRKLHIPGIFVFTLDITLKYIVLLGRFISDILTSYMLRAVGSHTGKYRSLGGVMGVAFLRGTDMSSQMVEAMRCRGFTDDYRGL